MKYLLYPDQLCCHCQSHFHIHHILHHPNLAGYRKWKKVIDTSAVKENGFLEQEQETYSKKLKVTPRTIVVLMAVEEEKKDASVAAL